MSEKTTITIPKVLREELRELAKKQGRTIIGLIKYLVDKENA